VFFLLAGGAGSSQSAFHSDFVQDSIFVGFGNFEYLFGNRYYGTLFNTAVFSVLVTVTA